jgi:hypothetical protein
VSADGAEDAEVLVGRDMIGGMRGLTSWVAPE